MNQMNRKQLSVICGLVAALFALFVWPTPYRYEHYGVGGAGLARINRITGSAEQVQPERPQESQADKDYVERIRQSWAKDAAEHKSKPLPKEVLRLLEVKCRYSSYDLSHEGRLSCSIYNGSDWTVGNVSLSSGGREYANIAMRVYGWRVMEPKTTIKFEFGEGLGMPSGVYSVTAATGELPKPTP